MEKKRDSMRAARAEGRKGLGDGLFLRFSVARQEQRGGSVLPKVCQGWAIVFLLRTW